MRLPGPNDILGAAALAVAVAGFVWAAMAFMAVGLFWLLTGDLGIRPPMAAFMTALVLLAAAVLSVIVYRLSQPRRSHSSLGMSALGAWQSAEGTAAIPGLAALARSQPLLAVMAAAMAGFTAFAARRR